MGPEDSQTTTPFDTAISEVQAKIDELRVTLATLLRLQAEYDGQPSVAPSRETEISHDSFFNMTIADAARKYLSMAKATKSTAQIAQALEEGGLKHSSKDFPTTVRSILGAREEFLRVPKGDWGLSEWYPGQGRGRRLKAEPASKKRQRSPIEPAGRQAHADGTRKERILAVMRTRPDKNWTGGEISKILNDKRKLVQATLGMLKRDGAVAKDKVGYSLIESE